jgi:hypothetical protein
MLAVIVQQVRDYPVSQQSTSSQAKQSAEGGLSPTVWSLEDRSDASPRNTDEEMKAKNKLSACRGEGSVAGLQLRVRLRFVPAALLVVLRTAASIAIRPSRGRTGFRPATLGGL